MKRLVLVILAVIVTIPFSTFAQDTVPALPPTKIILGAKRVYLANQSTDQKVFDNLEKKMHEWGRWEIVYSEEEADIMAVFSERTTNYGSYGSVVGISPGVTTGTLIPVVSDQRFLILVDKTGKRNLLTISCERRLSASYTAGVLVNRLQDRLKNDEKQLLKTQK